MKRRRLAMMVATSALLVLAPVALAQGAPAQVSVINLEVVRNPDGSQAVITPKGELVKLPGAGVRGNVAEIYYGAQGGFWYTDANGQFVDLTPTVHTLMQSRETWPHAQHVPKYEPMPDYAPPAGYAPPNNYAEPSSYPPPAGYAN